jgi:hypothetical protein
MENTQDASVTFEAEVTSRFGILPNFFRSAQAAPELLTASCDMSGFC